MTRFYTADEAAKELGVAYNTLRSLIHSGKLKAFKVGEGRTRSPWKITKEAIDEYIILEQRKRVESK